MAMESRLGCFANACRFLLFIINLFFMVLGLAILILGIVALINARSEGLGFHTAFAGGAGVCIASGTITVIVSIAGNIGVLFKLRPFLITYVLVLLLVVILEIVTGILVFVFRSHLQEILLASSLESISLYRAKETASDFRSNINIQVAFVQSTTQTPSFIKETHKQVCQLEFRCCGYHDASDWYTQNPDAVRILGRAPECEHCLLDTVNCTTFKNDTLGVSFNTTGMGCAEPASRPFTVLASVIGGLGILFAILQMFGIVLSCGLCCCITRARGRQGEFKDGELLMKLH